MKILNESSLNRVLQWIDNYDIVTISGFRVILNGVTPNTEVDEMHTQKPFSKNENRFRNKVLKARLIHNHFGVTNILGNYLENVKSKNIEIGEESFFVVNLENNPRFFDICADLGEQFNQDCILCKPKGEKNAYLIGTNNNKSSIGFHNKVVVGELQTLYGTLNMSRIGNALFSFINKEPKQIIYKDSKDDISQEELQDYEHTYLFPYDKPSFSKRKAERIRQKLSEDEIREINNRSILETIKDYNSFGRIALKLIAQSKLNEKE